MNEAKFTKGEWIQLESDHYFDCIEICALDKASKQTREIARVGSGFNEPTESECLANVNLIACAPEMYEMLSEVYNYYASVDDDGAYDYEIKKLLAKARGEQ